MERALRRGHYGEGTMERALRRGHYGEGTKKRAVKKRAVVSHD